MKNRKKGGNFLLLLIMLLVVSMSACSGGTQNESSAITSANTSTPAGQDTSAEAAQITPITLTAFSSPAQISVGGIKDKAIYNELARITGVKLDIVVGDSDKFMVLAAGGDLPDIIVMPDSADIQSLIASNAVIPLDELLDKYGENIKKNIPVALKYAKEIIGRGKTYFIPTATQQEDRNNPNRNGTYGFYTRYDLYKAIGSPEMKNEDDYLDVLKQMQDKTPETAAGKKVYALSGWSDWGLWPYLIPYEFHYGYAQGPAGHYMVRETGELENMYLKEGNIFQKALKFFNKAYMKGIFDPEAFTMKSDQYGKKVANGEVLATEGTFHPVNKVICGDQAALYMIPGPFPELVGVYPEESLLGWGASNGRAITSNCKNPERAMQFLNFCDSDEGNRLIRNGIKGVDWDIVDGKAQLIGKVAELGQASNEYSAKIGVGELMFFTSGTWTAADGQPIDLSTAMDMKLKLYTDTEADFAATYGTPDMKFPGQAYDKLIRDGKFKCTTKSSIVPWLTEQKSDSNDQTFARIEQYMKANISRIIMAKSDAEFDAAWKKAVEDIKAMGLEKAQKEYLDLLPKAQEIAKTLLN